MAVLSTNAGSAQSVTDAFPLVLTGTVTPGDIPVSRVLWTKDSGPDCAFTASTSWINQVYNLYAGTYVFRFAAFDQLDNTASSTVTITVTHTTGPIYPGYDPGDFEGGLTPIGLPYTLPFTLT